MLDTQSRLLLTRNSDTLSATMMAAVDATSGSNAFVLALTTALETTLPSDYAVDDSSIASERILPRHGGKGKGSGGGTSAFTD